MQKLGIPELFFINQKEDYHYSLTIQHVAKYMI